MAVNLGWVGAVGAAAGWEPPCGVTHSFLAHSLSATLRVVMVRTADTMVAEWEWKKDIDPFVVGKQLDMTAALLLEFQGTESVEVVTRLIGPCNCLSCRMAPVREKFEAALNEVVEVVDGYRPDEA